MVTLMQRRREMMRSAAAPLSEWDVEWDYSMGLPTVAGFEQYSSGTFTATLQTDGVKLTSRYSGSYVGYRWNQNYNKGVIEAVFNQTAANGQTYVGFTDGTKVLGVRPQYSSSYKGFYLMDATGIAGMTKIADMSLNTDYTLRLVFDTVGQVYVNGTLILDNIDLTTMPAALQTRFQFNASGSSNTNLLLKKLKLKFNRI